MIPNEYLRILSLLYDKTISNKVSWQKGTNNYSFITGFTNFSIAISEYDDQYNNEREYGISIYNQEGDIIDHYTVPEQDNKFAFVQNLFNESRRNALKINDAINEIMNELENDKQGGNIPKQSNQKNDDDLPF